MRRTKRIFARKGFSLVEVIVALAVIAIISTAAFSLVLSSAKLEADAVRTTAVSAAADDVLDCFRYADSNEEFFAAICKLDEYQTTDDGQYVLNKPSYTVYVNVDGDELSFNAYKTRDGETGELIYSYQYKKG
jgi:prepilin-type N-terminal cleavage/methylation domain-containing protein